MLDFFKLEENETYASVVRRIISHTFKHMIETGETLTENEEKMQDEYTPILKEMYDQDKKEKQEFLKSLLSKEQNLN